MLKLILTGGTIGSEINNGIIDTASRPPILERARGVGDFTFLTPFTVLSENMTFPLLIKLRETVAEAAVGADGIIVTHGTDTLAFTAAYLSLSLSALKIPVVLVSSDYPLSDPRANGMANFDCALRFIKESSLSGVFVAYKNPGERPTVHYGARLLEARSFDGAYYSAANQIAGILEGDKLVLSPCDAVSPGDELSRLDANVLWIKPHPGMDYGRYRTEGAAAVLHDSFHAGTVCTEAFNRFAADCPVPVYLAGGSAGMTYGSKAGLVGARVFDNISPVALYLKLCLAYSNGLSDDENYLKTNTAHEFF